MTHVMGSSEPRRTLGRYVLEEPIATGTTATIWRARDAGKNTTVAIKVFRSHLVADPVARARMDNEANAARQVHAPTIISAIDRISRRDEFALVFPYVPGTPLSERLRESAFTPEEAAAVAADIADALVAIHAVGLVHRDVKPGNVLLAHDGRARLLDFGISHALTDEIELDQALTGAGLAIGTLPYMAPEQLVARPLTPATDVYGLGVVLYEMLSGRRPFGATTPVALVEEQRVPASRIEDAPGPLVDLALRAMAHDAPARPRADELAASLRRWLVAPIEVDAPTAAVTTVEPAALAASGPARSRRRGLVTGAVAFAGMIVLAVVALAAVTPPSGPGTPPGGTAPLAAAANPSATAKSNSARSVASVAPAAAATPTSATSQPTAQPAAQPPAQPTATPAAQPPAPQPTPSPQPKPGGHHGGHAHHHHAHHHHAHHHPKKKRHHH